MYSYIGSFDGDGRRMAMTAAYSLTEDVRMSDCWSDTPAAAAVRGNWLCAMSPNVFIPADRPQLPPNVRKCVDG